MLEVREFQVEDAADVSRIMYDSFKTFLGHRMDNEKPQPLENFTRNGGKVRNEWAHGQAFTALMHGKVVGYINVSVDLRRKLGTLGTIGVDPNCMAHGAGTALFQAAWKFWMERDVNKIYTCTSSINTRAQRYYARMGFVEEGRRRRHFFSDVDEISLVIYPKRKSQAPADITCRAMKDEDVEAAVAILTKSGLNDWDEKWLRAHLVSSNSIFSHRAQVAVSNADGRVLGVMAYICINQYQLGITKFLCVEPEMRLKGIGTALIKSVIADCSTGSPLRKLDCNIPLDKVAGMPFMMHRGFVVEEALSEQGGPGTAEIHLGYFLE